MAKIAMRFFIIWLQACGLAIFSDSSVGISFPPECNAEGKVGLREIRFQSNHFPIFVDRCIFLHSFEERETKIQMRFSKIRLQTNRLAKLGNFSLNVALLVKGRGFFEVTLSIGSCGLCSGRLSGGKDSDQYCRYESHRDLGCGRNYATVPSMTVEKSL